MDTNNIFPITGTQLSKEIINRNRPKMKEIKSNSSRHLLANATLHTPRSQIQKQSAEVKTGIYFSLISRNSQQQIKRGF